ncbi:MAG: hypothetical protein WCI02_10760 [Planctomycetota bacterium]
MAGHHDKGEQVVTFFREMKKRILNDCCQSGIRKMLDGSRSIQQVVYELKHQLMFVCLPLGRSEILRQWSRIQFITKKTNPVQPNGRDAAV